MLIYCRLDPRNRCLLKFIQNATIYIQEYAFENGVNVNHGVPAYIVDILG